MLMLEFTVCSNAMRRKGFVLELQSAPLPAQVLCARHFISPALQMDTDGNGLFELHSL